MTWNVFKLLEDPDNPSLGPTINGLTIMGMWQPKNGLKKILYNILHIFAILFVLSQYVELWLIRLNLEAALRNLSVTMLSTVCVVKVGTFVIWQEHWKHIFDYVSNLEKEQMSKNDIATNNTIKDYIGYARRVTYIYWCLVTATVFSVILPPFATLVSSTDIRSVGNGSREYPEIMSSWVPFNKSAGVGYWALILEQTIICFYGGGIVANYDSNAVVLMSFFVGQLKLLKLNCERLFEKKTTQRSLVESLNKIRECHLQHINLVKYSKIINSLLSPVMFLYVIICSLMICASAIQLTTDSTARMKQIWIAEYLLALIAQLFFYCWHSNEMYLMSLSVEDGVWMSAWWSQNVQVRRSVLLLMGNVRKKIIFTAGPFTTLSVSTFVAILKGSYSYYTLLSKRDD